MFTKLIVGLDGRHGGEDALTLARMMARGNGEGELVLTHAYPAELLPSRAAERDYDAVVRADAERLLAEIAPPELPTTIVVVGDSFPGRALHHVAERQAADLIVIGSCHRGAVGRVLVGDVSRATLHDSPCPVAVAPRDYRLHAHAPKTVGVGFNDTPESRAALDAAAEIARATGAELRVMSVAHTPSPFVPGYASHFDLPDVHERRRLAAEQALEAAVAALAVPATSEMIDAAPSAALTEMSRHVDLLVTGSRGWGAARRVVLGSTADHLVHHAACPVVVVPRPEEAP